MSHGLLDTLTDGGLGVALLWPFALTRFFAPWRPIPIAPIGLAFLSPHGLIVRHYTWSPAGAHYRGRDVCFLASTVDQVIRGWR